MNDCYWCKEPVLEADDRTSIINGMTGERMWQHYECGMRAVIGSVAHMRHTCSCFVPGSDEGDPENMTRREAAALATQMWLARNGGTGRYPTHP